MSKPKFEPFIFELMPGDYNKKTKRFDWSRLYKAVESLCIGEPSRVLWIIADENEKRTTKVMVALCQWAGRRDYFKWIEIKYSDGPSPCWGSIIITPKSSDSTAYGMSARPGLDSPKSPDIQEYTIDIIYPHAVPLTPGDDAGGKRPGLSVSANLDTGVITEGGASPVIDWPIQFKDLFHKIGKPNISDASEVREPETRFGYSPVELKSVGAIVAAIFEAIPDVIIKIENDAILSSPDRYRRRWRLTREEF